VYTIFPICTPRSTFTLLHLVTYPRRLTWTEHASKAPWLLSPSWVSDARRRSWSVLLTSPAVWKWRRG
jgi:hypothetical protein